MLTTRPLGTRASASPPLACCACGRAWTMCWEGPGHLFWQPHRELLIADRLYGKTRSFA